MTIRAAAWITAGAVFVLDRLTKAAIERSIALYDNIHVIPGFFDLVHTRNRGAAFGLFADSDHPLRTVLLIGVSLAVLLFVAWLLLKPDRSGEGATRLTLFGLALVLGGALGNIYDRVMYGMVTDFLEFYLGEHRFAAFNVADSAITTGAGLLILDMWRTRKRTDAAQTH